MVIGKVITILSKNKVYNEYEWVIVVIKYKSHFGEFSRSLQYYKLIDAMNKDGRGNIYDDKEF